MGLFTISAPCASIERLPRRPSGAIVHMKGVTIMKETHSLFDAVLALSLIIAASTIAAMMY